MSAKLIYFPVPTQLTEPPPHEFEHFEADFVSLIPDLVDLADTLGLPATSELVVASRRADLEALQARIGEVLVATAAS
jgi:hypothetical protein